MRLNSMVLTVCAILFGSGTAHANVYNANATVTITSVLTYLGNDQILFTVNSLPSNPCALGYLEIPSTITAENRQIVYSRLLAAFVAKEPVNIGYDASTCGPNGYVFVARVG